MRRTMAVGLVLAVMTAAVSSASAASLYVTARDANAVAQFHIGAGGKLEALSPAIVGAGQKPSGIATSPNGSSAYALNLDSNDISQYDVSPSGALGAKSPFSYSLAPGLAGGQPGIAVAPGGANLYAVGNQTFAGVFQLAADSAGQVSLLDPPLLAVSDPIDIAIHPTLPKLYVSNKSGKKVQVMTIEEEGVLAHVFSPERAFTPAGVAITPDGRFLYAAATNSNSVAGFSIDATTGALTELSGSPFAFTEGNAQDVAVTNSSVYVTATGGGVPMFSIDPLTGVLTKKSPEKATTKSNPDGIAISPDGANAYVGTGTSIDQFAIGAGGVLVPLSPPSVATEKAPVPQLAVSAVGSGGGGEGPAKPVPAPPPDKPPPPPPPPKVVTEYLAYQHKMGEVLVMKVTKADGKTIKVELEVGKCYPPPNEKVKCAGLVEVKTRKAGNLVVVDEDARAGTKSVTLAKGSFSIPAGKSGKIVLRPTAAGRKVLKGKFLTAWLVTKLKNGPETIAGQQKIKFRLKQPG